MSNLETITNEIRSRIESFLTTGELPAPIIINDECKVEFEYETWVDDEDFDAPLLRNQNHEGLQVHEYLDGEPYSYIADDELEGGWVIFKDDTPENIALQICADFDLA